MVLEHVHLGSILTLVVICAAAIFCCIRAITQIFRGRRILCSLVVTMFCAGQLIFCTALHRAMSPRSFQEAQTAVLSFLNRPAIHGVSYAEGVVESDIALLQGQRVDVITLYSFQPYQSYEFLIRPKAAKAFHVQVQGSEDARRLYVYPAVDGGGQVTKSPNLKKYETSVLGWQV